MILSGDRNVYIGLKYRFGCTCLLLLADKVVPPDMLGTSCNAYTVVSPFPP